MNKLTVVLMFAGLAVAAGPAQTYTGVITDSMCKMDHKPMNLPPDEKCVKECVRLGSKYVLMVGTKVYGLSDQQAPAAFAAKRATVSGTLDAKTGMIQVAKIEAAK